MAWWIFQNLVSTAALAVVVAALCRFTRIGPVARHALWVLVLIKFVTPPLVVWPWAAPDPFGLAVGVAVPAQSSAGATMSHPAPLADIDPTHSSDHRLLVADHAADPEGATTIPVWPLVFGIWAAGSLAVIVIECVRLARVARRVKDARRVDPAVITRAAQLSAQLGLRPVPVVGVAGRDAPAVWGLGRPRLLWPAELAAEASDACIDGLLLHELAHVRRRDHIVGWIELAAGVVWWWNPIFWHVRSALREQAELACDAWVIAALPNGRRAYAESLLMLSGPEVRGMPPVAVMGMRAGSRRVLERRLVMIMKGRAPFRLSWAGLVALIVLAGATLPAWATSPQQTKAQQTQPDKPKVVVPDVKVLPRTVVRDGKTYVLTPKDEAVKYTLSVKDEQAKVVDVQVQPKVVTQEKKVDVAVPARKQLTYILRQQDLPEDGRKLVEGFAAEKDAIQAEADRKVVERRDAVAKSLQSLQDRYTKEGKLDEAIAIRDYLRAGMPGLDGNKVLIRR